MESRMTLQLAVSDARSVRRFLSAVGLALTIPLAACSQAAAHPDAGLPGVEAGPVPSVHALVPGGGQSASERYGLNHGVGQPSPAIASSPSYQISRGVLPAVGH